MSFLFRGEIQDEGGFVAGKLVYNNVIRETEQVFHMCKYSHDVTKDIKIKPETVQIKFGDRWYNYEEFEHLGMRVDADNKHYLNRYPEDESEVLGDLK